MESLNNFKGAEAMERHGRNHIAAIASLLVLAGCVEPPTGTSFKNEEMGTDMKIDMAEDMQTPDMDQDQGVDMELDMGVDLGDLDMGVDLGSDMKMDMPEDMQTPDMDQDQGVDMGTDLPECSAEMKEFKNDILGIIDKANTSLPSPNNVLGSMYGNFHIVCGNELVETYDRGTNFDTNTMMETNNASIKMPNCSGYYTFGQGPLGSRPLISGSFQYKNADRIVAGQNGYFPSPNDPMKIDEELSIVKVYKLNLNDNSASVIEDGQESNLDLCDDYFQEIVNY
jgi:hypothetical protein